jgi:outer membrane lipoprotein-sorting protein
MKPLILLLSLSFFIGLSQAWADKKNPLPEASTVLHKLDYLYRASSSLAEVKMVIETPDWTRTLEMTMWSRGLKDTLIRIKSPKKDQGIATLKHDQDMWNYFPKINKVMKVPPSMMMSSWMGSDLTNDDLVRESSFENDYEHDIAAAGDNKLQLTLTPKKNTVTVWSKIDLVVNRDSLLPQQEIFYNERGETIRKILFKDVKTIDGRTLPTAMVVIPLKKEGHKTTISYQKLDFDIELDDDIFSLRNLKQRL